MIENRLKFDRDVLAHGGDWYDDYDEYGEWDPFLDLEDEELAELLRKLHTRMDTDQDGLVDVDELAAWSLVAMFNIAGHEAAEDWEDTIMGEDEELSFQNVMENLYEIKFEKPPYETHADNFDINYNVIQCTTT